MFNSKTRKSTKVRTYLYTIVCLCVPTAERIICACNCHFLDDINIPKETKYYTIIS